MNRALRRLCALCIACCLLATPIAGHAATVSYVYPASDAVITNPYIGHLVWASDTSERQQPFTLVYADVTWAELEPKKGHYDFEAFEKRNNLEHWREAGKHVVLRFVVDIPGDKKHMDIPKWLYDETEGDGQYYHTSYGRGYSPNYSNKTFIEAHARAIRALGERYGQDPLIAFVQLGSLGHWGEWHVHEDAGFFPLVDDHVQYVTPYLDAFPKAKLMMRRSFASAAKYNLGIFNDSSGDVQSTETWLAWISYGGQFDQTGETDVIVPMPGAWRFVPMAGELSTSNKKEDLLGDSFEQTLSLFERSHTSWIGPNSFAGIKHDSKYQENLDTLMKRIGYRLRVDRLDVASGKDDEVTLSFTWVNDGIAPFYFPWEVCLRMMSEHGTEQRYPLPFSVGSVQPGAPFTMKLTLTPDMFPAGECTLSVGILDPETGNPGVQLAMETPSEENWYELGRVTAR